MKIATWNIERMTHSPAQIQSACEKVQADILVLTESDDRISPKYKYRFHTPTVRRIKAFQTALELIDRELGTEDDS